jgi:FkbM family methyltransferase
MIERASLLQRIAASIERRAQKFQGKGSGGHSVEAEVLTAMAFLPAEGAVVFDIGANKGLWSRAMLRQAGPRLVRLVAFEPSNHNGAALEGISDPRFTLVPQGISDRNGSAQLHMDAPGSGLASLSKRNLDHVGIEMRQHEVVDLTTLDSYAEIHGIGRIDFMKLDIEGHELSALHGAEGLLRTGAIRALSFEFGGSNIDTRTFFRDFWLLLRGYGYSIWRIVPGGAPVRIEKYHERLECFATTNFIAKLER